MRPARTAPPSARSTTSGSSTASSASKSPLARGGEEGIDDFSLAASGRRRAAWPLPAPGGARGSRAAVPRSGERPTMGAISSKGTSNMSCSTNASRSAGASVSSTTSSARPTESASSASCSGSIPSSRLDDRVGHVRAERLLAPRRCASAACPGTRARRPSSASRRGSRRRSVSERLSRSQASCTASSASLSEPSIR